MGYAGKAINTYNALFANCYAYLYLRLYFHALPVAFNPR